MRPGRRTEDGVAVVLALGLVAVLVLLAVTSAAVVAAVGTHRSVQGAADLAALAGAAVGTGATRGGGACAEVRRIAAANSAEVRACVLDGPDVAVVLEARLHLGPYSATFSARARAGPERLLD